MSETYPDETPGADDVAAQADDAGAGLQEPAETIPTGVALADAEPQAEPFEEAEHGGDPDSTDDGTEPTDNLEPADDEGLETHDGDGDEEAPE